MKINLKDKVTGETYSWEDITSEVPATFPDQKRGFNSMIEDLKDIPEKIDPEKVKAEEQAAEAISSESSTSSEQPPKNEQPAPSAPALPGDSMASKTQILNAKLCMKGLDSTVGLISAVVTGKPEAYEIAKLREKDLKDMQEILAECFAVSGIDFSPWYAFLTGLSGHYSGRIYDVYSYAKAEKGKDVQTLDEKIKIAEQEARLAELQARIREAGGTSSRPATNKAATSPQTKPTGQINKGGRPAGTKNPPGAKKPGRKPGQ